MYINYFKLIIIIRLCNQNSLDAYINRLILKYMKNTANLKILYMKSTEAEIVFPNSYHRVFSTHVGQLKGLAEKKGYFCR